VTDDTSKAIADIMWNAANSFKNRTMIVMTDRETHGAEPPLTVASAMASADVIFGITKYSMFHSNARRNAVKNGARFANMADYSVEMMESGSLFTDFIGQGKLCDRFSEVLSGNEITITSKEGTKIKASICGSIPLRQYGRSLNPGSSSSPPDIETAICAIQGSANGVVIIDGSIPLPSLGVLNEKITLQIENGRVSKIFGGDEADKLSRILKEMNDDTVYYIGEIGIALNPDAKLMGRMLEDEGVMGTIHFGFGSNISFGGTINSNNHIDMIFKAPTLAVDGRILMEDGVIVI
jgi:leucyl aminopeptidase (aminopeptidase T)